MSRSFRVRLPFRFAFFEEGGDAFFEVGGGADLRVLVDGFFQVFVDAGGGGVGEEAFSAGEACWAGVDQCSGEFVGARLKIFWGDDFSDEAEFLGFRCGDEAAGEQEVAGALVADLAGEKNGDDGGEEADFDFGVAEFGFGDGEGEIAEGGDAAASGDGCAVYRGDERLGEAPDAAEHLGHAAGIFEILFWGLLGDGGEGLRSMPAQKALPVPVRMATRVGLFSIWSRAASKSEVIWGEMALRFSGRERVMSATSPEFSSWRVSNIALLRID